MANSTKKHVNLVGSSSKATTYNPKKRRKATISRSRKSRNVASGTKTRARTRRS